MINDGDIIRTSARFKSEQSGDVVNVFHWAGIGLLNETDDDVMDAIEDKLDAAYAEISQQLPNQMDPYDIRHDLVEWVAGKETVVRTLGTRTWTLTTPPASNNDPAASQLAAIVNFRTSEPKTFGRKYIGTLAYNATANSALTGTFLTTLAAWAAEILDSIAMASGGLAPGVFSYKEIAGSHFVSFVAAIISNFVGIQRRRRVNTGS